MPNYSTNNSFKKFDTIHDLRFPSPPGALDTREFIGIDFSGNFIQDFNNDVIIKISDQSRSYFIGKVFEIKSIQKINIIPHSLSKNNPLTIEASVDGKTIKEILIHLKKGSYTKI